MAGGVAAVQHNFKQYPSVSLLPSSQSTFCGTKFITSIQYKRKVCQPKGALNVTASSSKKILVMGGTRFIGIFLSRKLVEEGHQVTLFTRGKAPVTQPLPGEADDAYNAFKSKILHLKGDRKDYDFVRTSVAAGGFDVVYDINGREAEEVEPILDALPNLEQYIYCSSAGVYLKSDLLPHREIDAVDPKSRHKGKLETEALLESKGVNYTSIRPVYIYGPLNYNPVEEWFFHRLKAGRPIPIPNSGLQVTQLGHVKDLATAFIKVLGNAKASKQVYNISGDRYVTFDGLARACAKAGGFPEPELIHYNPKEFDFGKKKAFPFRDQHFFASVEKAKEELGIVPEYGLVEGLTDSYNLDFGRGTFRKAAGWLPVPSSIQLYTFTIIYLYLPFLLALSIAMAAAVSVAVSLPSSKSTLISTRPSLLSQDRVSFTKVPYYKNVSTNGKPLSIRAQITTEAEAAAPAKVEKVSKKQEEGVVTNKYKPKEPYIGRCLLNTKITGDDAPGETWHMVFSTEGEIPYREGQSIGVIPDGIDPKNGKPHKLRLYSIASSALGDFGDSKTVSLCVKRLVYTNDKGEEVKGVCSNFLCDLKPGAEVQITGPVGKEMLMPKDPNATVIMLATGTGIAPFRSFMWKMFFEKHEDYQFNGLAWLFLGVPTSSSLLYKEEFEKMKEMKPDNLRVDFAVSREQTNEKGEKMYIQTRMAQYDRELWELLKKDNTFVYMCGLKGMEKGIDDIMTTLAAEDGIEWATYKKQLKKEGQWNVEVY